MPTAERADAVPLDDLLADREWVRALARSLTPDAHRAEDLEQRTWLAALRRPPSTKAAARGWLARVTRNLARDLWRSDVRRAAREQVVARKRGADPSSDALPADELAARAEIHRRLMQAVLGLREPYQTTVLLRFFDGLEPAEIAKRSGVAAATVRSRLHRALAELRGTLERDGTHERAVWLLALPASGLGKTSSLGTSLGGGLAVTAKNKVLAGALLLLALGGAGWWLVGDFAAGEGDPETPAEGADVAGTGESAPDAGAAEAKEPVRRPRKKAVAPGAASAPADDGAEGAEAAAGSGTPAAGAEAGSVDGGTAAASEEEGLAVEFRRFVDPLTVPPGYTEIASLEEIPEITGPEPGAGAGRQGPQALPYWSRWPFPPKKGSVILEGRVVDSGGKPIEGATVYRIDITRYAEPGPVLSYQYIDEVAKTDPNGHFRATGVIPGEMLIWADYQRQLVAARGLRVEGAQRANPAENERIEGLELRLPIEVGQLGAVEGTVLDWQGKPARRVEISIGPQRERTDRQGRFRVNGVAAGDRSVRVSHLGHQAQTVPVTVETAGTASLEVRLELNSEGKLHFAGRVVDSFGDPVARTELFLGTGRYQDQRRGWTDDRGRFRFERLPDALAEGEVSLSLMGNPDTSPLMMRTERGLKVPQDAFEFVVQRAIPVTLRYVSKLTGDRLAQIKYDLRPAVGESGDEWAKGGRSGGQYTETGEADLRMAPGRYLMTARARGHRGMEVTFEVPATPGAKVVVLEFQPE